MLDNVCPNCGKKHYWYELKKRDPITKEQVCRNCNTPSRSKEIQQKTTTKKVLESSPTKKYEMKKLVNDVVLSFNQIKAK